MPHRTTHHDLAEPPALRRRRRVAHSLAGQLFAVQVLIVAVVVAGGAVLAYVWTSDRAQQAAERQVVATARAVADAPSVAQAVVGPDPTAALQPYAVRVGKDAGVDFVTIMDIHGVRWTHPDPAEIGKHFLGHIAPALAGRTFTETYTGTLGPSVRAVTPVRDANGRIVALVSVGITIENLTSRLRGAITGLVLVALAALALGGLGTWLANRRLRRHTHGMGAAELSHLYEYHQATLHSVREGLVLLDRAGTVVLCNDAARELLGLTGPAEGRAFAELALPEPLRAAVAGPEPVRDQLHLTADRVVVVNTSPIGDGSGLGTVVTFRDHTELQALSGELDSVRGFAEALSAQAHEAANRLHAVVSLIETGRHRQAVDFATAELELAQQLTDRVVGAIDEPVLAALLLGKAAQAAERGVDLVLTEESRIDDALPAQLSARDLVTLLGNLIDNAMDAAIEGTADHDGPPTVTVTARTDAREMLLRVADTGRGIAPDAVDRIFERGWSTKPSGEPGESGQLVGRGIGLALVAQAARRNGGSVEVGSGRGAVLTVRIPLQRAAENEVAREGVGAR
ncbi:ATP-binding protein [Streptacidiphilus fuscans]|uniref:histidine kinase n=1 Tax=Streptacidiphilus fuscans TaxID=2789292 RepID=A0A931B3K7_9ACTN|nr:sensor histidine kinase [Streptacidiphilus fuscans]MBF9068662.1 sensor histidine kinase [Streptacidiphilus fuscans]